jgi:Lrp/AsnC family transcriptional regulator, leucine-responsive regulatory protein
LVLDRKDIEILELLQADGSRSNKELAGRVSLSASACLERVRKLERDGVIERYAALLNPRAFEGVVEGVAEIVLAQRTEAIIGGLIEHLSGESIVVDIFELTGPFDFSIRFVAPTHGDWQAFARELERDFPIASLRHGVVIARRVNRPLAIARLSAID